MLKEEMNNKQILLNIVISASTTLLIMGIFIVSGVIPISFPSSFEAEVKYYENEGGCMLFEHATWEDFQIITQWPTVRVLKEQLHHEVAEIKALKNYCEIFVDREAQIIWVQTMNPYSTEPSLVIYWWKVE